MFSILRLYRSAEERLIQKKDASQGYERHSKARLVCDGVLH